MNQPEVLTWWTAKAVIFGNSFIRNFVYKFNGELYNVVLTMT